MKLFKSSEQIYIESSQYTSLIKEAQERMKFKTFTQRFAPLNQISSIGMFFFPVLSVLLSTTFIAGFISAVFNIYIAIAIAIILLSFWEVAKNMILKNAFEIHYSNQGNAVALFIVASVFSLVSIIFAYNGAEELVHSLESKTQVVHTEKTTARDSIVQVHSAKIDSYNAELSNLKAKAKKQWKGLNTPTQEAQISQLLDAIAFENATMQNALAKLDKDSDLKLDKTQKEIFYSVYWSKILALIIEGLIIASIWFVAFFHFKTTLQNILLTKGGFIKNDQTPKDTNPQAGKVIELPEHTETSNNSDAGTGTSTPPPAEEKNSSSQTTQTDTQIAAKSSPQTPSDVPPPPAKKGIGFIIGSAEPSTRVGTRVLDYEKMYIIDEMKNILGTPVNEARIAEYGKNKLMRDIIDRHPEGYTGASTFYSIFEMVEQFPDEINNLKA